MSATVDGASEEIAELNDAFFVSARVAAVWSCAVADVTVRVCPEHDGWIGEVVGPHGARVTVIGHPSRREAAHALSKATSDQGALVTMSRASLTPARSLAARVALLPATDALEALERATLGVAVQVERIEVRAALYQLAGALRDIGEALR